MPFDRITTLTGLAAFSAALLVVALLCHQIARLYVDRSKLDQWTGWERQMHAFWFSMDMLIKQGRIWAILRNWAFGLGVLIFITIGIIQDYIWIR
jgi:hypothetical protein